MWPTREQTDDLLAAARDGKSGAVDDLLGKFRDPLRQVVGLRLDPVLARRVDASDIVIHDASDLNLSFALSRLSTQDLSHTVTGVVRRADRPTYDDSARAQVSEAKATKAADLSKLLHGKDTWTVVG